MTPLPKSFAGLRKFTGPGSWWQIRRFSIGVAATGIVISALFLFLLAGNRVNSSRFSIDLDAIEEQRARVRSEGDLHRVFVATRLLIQHGRAGKEEIASLENIQEQVRLLRKVQAFSFADRSELTEAIDIADRILSAFPRHPEVLTIKNRVRQLLAEAEARTTGLRQEISSARKRQDVRALFSLYQQLAANTDLSPTESRFSSDTSLANTLLEEIAEAGSEHNHDRVLLLTDTFLERHSFFDNSEIIAHIRVSGRLMHYLLVGMNALGVPFSLVDERSVAARAVVDRSLLADREILENLTVAVSEARDASVYANAIDSFAAGCVALADSVSSVSSAGELVTVLRSHHVLSEFRSIVVEAGRAANDLDQAATIYRRMGEYPWEILKTLNTRVDVVRKPIERRLEDMEGRIPDLKELADDETIALIATIESLQKRVRWSLNYIFEPGWTAGPFAQRAFEVIDSLYPVFDEFESSLPSIESLHQQMYRFAEKMDAWVARREASATAEILKKNLPWIGEVLQLSRAAANR